MKNLLSAIFKFFRTWNEVLLLPAAVIVWVGSVIIIRFIDPTAAVFDVAVFQKIVFGIIAFLVYSFLSWLVLWIAFPKIFRFLTEDFENQFSNLTPNAQCVISFCLLAYHLLGLVLCGLIL